MRNMETKSIALEVKDFDKEKRTVVVAHAAYNNIDRTKDISRKGMFTKSWNENREDIAFYKNHNSDLTPGKVVDFWEDDSFAYTKAFLGTHTLGEDTLRMLDEGIITKASFGYLPVQKNFIDVKGEKIRELKEVRWFETSVLTVLQANPLAKVRSVTKSFDDMLFELKQLSVSENAALKKIMASDFMSLDELMRIAVSADEKSDLYTWVMYQISRRTDFISDLRSQLKYNSGDLKSLQQDIETMEKFCANTKASDECIMSVQNDIKEAKNILSKYDTAYSQAAKALDPDASKTGRDFSIISTLIKN